MPPKLEHQNESFFRRRYGLVFLLTLIALIFASVMVINEIGVPPRSLAPYLLKRSSGHNVVIERSGEWVFGALQTLDRGVRGDFVMPRPILRGVDTKNNELQSTRIVDVNSVALAMSALETANPGDAITFAPGVYRFNGRSIPLRRPGSASQDIKVRAEQPGSVVLEFNLEEGFLVLAPYWTFENLTIKGVCKEDSDCEHAFHVVGEASHFVARNNTITDFNAHFKINGNLVKFPDSGLIEANILRNTTPRQTDKPVTLIDLVAASQWLVRGNVIADFLKARGDRVSYGAFAKGAGQGNRFEQNMVVCEDLLRNYPGQRVGLSLGGGGTTPVFCRDKRCITEQQQGVVTANLIASCSDSGIYINRSGESKVSHNTLIDTGPLSIRFPESSADVVGNLVDSAIQARDGALLRLIDNRETSMAALFVGHHPVRRLFVDTGKFDLRWKGAVVRREVDDAPVDLCGLRTERQPAYGAFDDYSKCFEGHFAK